MISEDIIDKINSNKRLTRRDGLKLFEEEDLISIGRLADYVRGVKVSTGVASYVIYMNINYTNICKSMCSFCAFSRNITDKDAYVLGIDEMVEKISRAIDVGIEGILLQGGLHPEYKIDYYIDMISEIKRVFPGLHIHGFSPPEIKHISECSGLKIEEVIVKLSDAGLDSIPGGGAEILDDSIRKKLSPNKCSTRDWLEVMRKAHLLGIKTSATMMFGSIETYKERINHMDAIRKLQDETKGFTAFIPWTYQPIKVMKQHLNGRDSILDGIDEASAVDYLKTVAIARIFLDNFEHIEASIVTQGPKIAQLALAFGADDIGSVMIEENVVRAAGNSYVSTEDELIYLIEEAGFKPAMRDLLYSKYEVKRKKCNIEKK